MNLTELRKICEEATPEYMKALAEIKNDYIEHKSLTKEELDALQYILHISPPFVLKLLAVVEAAKGLQYYSRHGANEGWVDWDKYFDPTMKAIDALEEV